MPCRTVLCQPPGSARRPELFLYLNCFAVRLRVSTLPAVISFPAFFLYYSRRGDSLSPTYWGTESRLLHGSIFGGFLLLSNNFHSLPEDCSLCPRQTEYIIPLKCSPVPSSVLPRRPPFRRGLKNIEGPNACSTPASFPKAAITRSPSENRGLKETTLSNNLVLTLFKTHPVIQVTGTSPQPCIYLFVFKTPSQGSGKKKPIKGIKSAIAVCGKGVGILGRIFDRRTRTFSDVPFSCRMQEWGQK